jgi:uncharacterized protein YceK
MKIIISILAMSLICGCLQVVRTPIPLDKYADDGSVTNRTWTSLFDKRPDLRVFPTVKRRCAVTKEYFSPIDQALKGRDLHNAIWFKRLGWIPLTIIWATSPFDAVGDVVFLPYDLYANSKGERHGQ